MGTTYTGKDVTRGWVHVGCGGWLLEGLNSAGVHVFKCARCMTQFNASWVQGLTYSLSTFFRPPDAPTAPAEPRYRLVERSEGKVRYTTLERVP